MPSTISDFTVNVNDTVYIDRWGISTLAEFITALGLQVWNKSPREVYIKALIEDPNSNWTFDDNTTTKQLGKVDGFNYENFYVNLKRAVPSTDVEDEQFTLKIEFYKDNSYSQKVDTLSKTITVNIIDFRNTAGWTTQIDDFDDCTAQGWSLSGFTVSSSASVNPNGCSLTFTKTSSSGTAYIAKSISVPTGVQKATLVFYYGVAGYGTYKDESELRVYVNNTKVFSLRSDGKKGGWWQSSIDLTQYAGQNITVKIEEYLKAWGSVTFALDDIIFAYKS